MYNKCIVYNVFYYICIQGFFWGDFGDLGIQGGIQGGGEGV